MDEQNQDVKLCPFCGEKPVVTGYYGDPKPKAYCVGCRLEINLEVWNFRPLEADLETENAALRRKIARQRERLRLIENAGRLPMTTQKRGEL